ncbi:MAG: hypothetical protein C9356_02115 [Oleiphilus sp.]|nr:MAG: hypothetical protein C9356_02115 [Oleiphilus sp.]
MSKRQVLGNVLSRMGLLGLLRRLEKRRPSLKILAYHRIKDIDVGKYLFDEELVDATVQDFDRQMAFISRHYQVLPLSEAYDLLTSGKPVDQVVSVTFDDGFEDLYTNMFPIVKKYDIRPTVFIATDLIGTSETLWTEKIVQAVKTAHGKTLDIAFVNEGQPIQVNAASQGKIIAQILRHTKDIPYTERLAYVDKLFNSLAYAYEEHPDSRFMSWEMVQEMSAWGVEFGSHTCKHAVLASVDYETQKYELEASKAEIERRLSKPCRNLAYPYGGPKSTNKETERVMSELSYDHACSYISGVNYPDTVNRFQLRRLHVDRTVDLNWFKAKVTRPSLFAADFYKN